MPSSVPFDPPPLLRNRHVQSILGSSGLRTRRVRRQASEFLAASRDEILDCGDGIRLHGRYTGHPAPERGLVILIHGWHGNADSNYLLAAASHLYARGFSVFRLHLRDHGPSHHLNRELFNSTRLPEVISAVQQIAVRHPHTRTFLGGFSLGGNFALRVALQAPARGIRIDRVVAVCPVLDPVHTMDALSASFVYHQYFMRKWRRALSEKLRHFPDLGYAGELLELGSLQAMNEFFVPRYTEFTDTLSYLKAYAITGDKLRTLEVPSRIVTSRDDPVIPSEDLARLATPKCLEIEVTEYGGHCGFLQNWHLDSWIDQHLDTLLN